MRILFLLPLTIVLQINQAFSQWEVKHFSQEFITLNIVEFYGQDTGFAMGNKGLVLKSIDNGEEWEEIDTDINGL